MGKACSPKLQSMDHFLASVQISSRYGLLNYYLTRSRFSYRPMYTLATLLSYTCMLHSGYCESLEKK